MSRAGRVIVLTVALAAATWAGGWTAVPLVAFLWGAWRRRDLRAPVSAAVAAALAWGVLFVLGAFEGPLLTVADRIGGLAGVPGIALLVFALAFAAGLAWSAAEIGRVLLLIAVGAKPANG